QDVILPNSAKAPGDLDRPSIPCAVRQWISRKVQRSATITVLKSSQDPIINFIRKRYSDRDIVGTVELETRSRSNLPFARGLLPGLLVSKKLGQVATLVENHDQHDLSDMESSWLVAMLYTLRWLILAMACFSAVQLKVQEEFDNVAGRSDKDADLERHGTSP
ncbi:cytochrome p450 306a1, partial [Moniliophthora roreri]